MFSWTEKVTGKLSRLRSDSASSHSDLAGESDVARRDIQEFPLSGEELSSRATKISSYLFSLVPTALANVDTQRLTNIRRVPLPSLPSLPSLPKRWKGHAFPWAHEPLDQDSDDEHEHPGEEEAPGATGKISEDVSVLVPESSPSSGPRSLPSSGGDESTFISAHLFEFLESSLPNLVKGCRWVLLYSTLKHGISLRTLLRRSSDLPGPCILIVGDMQGAVFGGLLDAPIKPTAKRKFQGNSQTFIFTTKYGDPRIFRPTGANRYYYLCLDELLAFGGGGNFALCLDEDLLHGTSGPCDTFGNSCLAHTPDFELKNVELWGFSHASGFSSLDFAG